MLLKIRIENRRVENGGDIVPMWLKNCWQLAAYASEIGDRPLARRLVGEPVVLYRLKSGIAVALQDRCPHRSVPLSIGRRVGDEIQCGYHGLKFGGDGRCTHIPGQATIPANSNAVSYPLLERHGLAWIWLGQRHLADESPVPNFPWMDPPSWIQSYGYHHFECDYQLMNDNLLDLSHETYVHQSTIGNKEEQSIAEFPARITVEEGSIIRVHREMPNIKPPPFFAMFLNTTQPIDRWQTAIYTPPGIHMTEAGAYITGSSRSNASINRIMHLLTPETPTSTHYFWCVARNYRLGEANLSESIANAASRTFDEDKLLLELQQRSLSQTPEKQMPRFAIQLDEAPLRARRILEKWIKSEMADASFVVPVKPLVSDEAATPAMCVR
jgi:phenylpropionate dioxygenase-like ring-hydroxylating dioxygenase large terminal subunit